MQDCVVETWYGGQRSEFRVIEPALTILEAARAAGVELPASCEAGSCATCRARLRAGEVEMLNNLVLDEREIAAGWVLACQSLARTPRIVLDFDATA